MPSSKTCSSETEREGRVVGRETDSDGCEGSGGLGLSPGSAAPECSHGGPQFPRLVIRCVGGKCVAQDRYWIRNY